MRTLCVSGWGQPHDALRAIAPHATHCDYGNASDMDAALQQIGEAGKNHDLVIGWSLGGQMALHAIARGLLKPKKLVVIASAFRFVSEAEGMLGMGPDTYAKFVDNYTRSPERTLRKGWELIIKGDSQPERIREHLGEHDMRTVLATDWLAWLHRLRNETFEGIDLSHCPPTLLVHGVNDVVVEPAQSQHFADVIPHARVELWPDCGHAPHWHNATAFKKLVAEFAHV